MKKTVIWHIFKSCLPVCIFNMKVFQSKKPKSSHGIMGVNYVTYRRVPRHTVSCVLYTQVPSVIEVCTTRCAPIRARFFPALWFPFFMARYEEKQQNLLLLLTYFIEGCEISTECVFWYSCHSVVIWYCDMNWIKSNKTFCCIFLSPAMQRETNMTVPSRMTCKIGLIWRLMKTFYCWMCYPSIV